MFKLLSIVALFGFQSIAFADTLPGFSASFDHKKRSVQVSWQQAPGAKTYSIQRSKDNKNWKDIGLIQTGGQKTYYYEDNNPAEGENHYRVRANYANSASDLSASAMIIMPPAAKGWVMYPIPAKDFVTLEYRGAEPIKGVINVFIQQSSGRIISRLRSSSLNKSVTIPVHNLGAGVYDVRIVVQGELVWNQRFVK